MVQLSKRMLAIAQMVSRGHKVADVGCDHGYLPIWLVQEQICPSAIALDIGEGPLQRAEKNIRENHLAQYIETRRSDGTEKLSPGECQTLIIAGMGGPLMEKILSDHWEITRGFEELILEPQSDVRHMRIFLSEYGYRIIEENMILEDGKYYPILHVLPGAMEPLTPVQIQYGPCLLAAGHPVLWQYLKHEERQKCILLEKLQSADGERARTRMRELKEELALVQEALAQLAGAGGAGEALPDR